LPLDLCLQICGHFAALASLPRGKRAGPDKVGRGGNNGYITHFALLRERFARVATTHISNPPGFWPPAPAKIKEINQHIRFEIRAHHNRDGHEQKNASR